LPGEKNKKNAVWGFLIKIYNFLVGERSCKKNKKIKKKIKKKKFNKRI